MRHLLGLLICLPLCACGATGATTALNKDDPFRPYRAIESGVHTAISLQGRLVTKLVAQIDRKSNATVLLLKVHHSYTGQRRHNYESARNARAELLNFVSLARYGSCRTRTDCPLDEMYTIEIPEADLRTATAAGYPLKVFPRTGPDLLINVPAETIRSILALLDLDRAGGAAAAARS